MADKDVLLALGARRGTLSFYKRALLQLERERLRRPVERDDLGRCHAGVQNQLAASTWPGTSSGGARRPGWSRHCTS
jgi:hypothetical protein